MTDSNENAQVQLNAFGEKSVLIRKPGQIAYWNNLEKLTSKENRKDVVLALGGAGTGKTYLAVAKASLALKSGKFERIIAARPAVDAGEKLGFLPGTADEKLQPYMMPIFDALTEWMGPRFVEKKREEKVIEIIPVAFMRGRTFKNAFVIVDEAQNCTKEQMEMVLTRLGQGSKMVIVGDPNQSDLPKNQSGFKKTIEEIKENIGELNEIAISELAPEDCERHPLVGKLLKVFNHGS